MEEARPVRQWTRKWRHTVACARCGRNCTWGATHPRDNDDPPRNAVCWRCWNGLPTEGEQRAG